MHRTALLEELSRAYVHATATAAGAAYQRVDPDLFGVDARITGSETSAPGPVYVDLQLKATARAPRPDPTGRGRLGFDLEVKDHERLRQLRRLAPIYLVVLFAPPETERWVEHSEERLLMRRCAYWLSLQGVAASANRFTVRVWLPSQQRLDGNALAVWLRQASQGLEKPAVDAETPPGASS